MTFNVKKRNDMKTKPSITLSYIKIILVMILFSCSPQNKKENSQNTAESDSQPNYTGSVEVMDEELHDVINTDARPEIIGEGFEWSEGPVWVESEEFVLFSDIPVNSIYKWKEGEGVSRYLKPSGYTGDEEYNGEPGSNGLILDQNNTLVLAQHGDRRIARMKAELTNPKPEFETIAAEYNGKQFNSPNDVVRHSNGNFYFTDPPYGLKGGVDGPGKELDFQGVFMVDASGNGNGEVTLLTDKLSRPNGIAFSPDEQTLYVANSDPDRAIWMAYDLKEDGTIENGRIFYDATKNTATEKGLPDGMKVDENGYIFATGPGGVWIFADDGRALGRIKTGQATSNGAIGNNGNTLYITADMYLMRFPLGTE